MTWNLHYDVSSCTHSSIKTDHQSIIILPLECAPSANGRLNKHASQCRQGASDAALLTSMWIPAPRGRGPAQGAREDPTRLLTGLTRFTQACVGLLTPRLPCSVLPPAGGAKCGPGPFALLWELQGRCADFFTAWFLSVPVPQWTCPSAPPCTSLESGKPAHAHKTCVCLCEFCLTHHTEVS